MNCLKCDSPETYSPATDEWGCEYCGHKWSTAASTGGRETAPTGVRVGIVVENPGGITAGMTSVQIISVVVREAASKGTDSNSVAGSKAYRHRKTAGVSAGGKS